ncbi:MAG TPA: hypothetical protein PLU22_26170, partial [Polyangiaceae bacterium]|nr:hypothetical protein [Polyangiaceae bacterium]
MVGLEREHLVEVILGDDERRTVPDDRPSEEMLGEGLTDQLDNARLEVGVRQDASDEVRIVESVAESLERSLHEVERRLRLAAQADFAMGFYNPRSASRPHQFARALEILREECGPD